MNRNNASQALFALGRWDEAIAQTDIVRGRIEFRFAGRMACIIRARVAAARGEDDLAASLMSWVEVDGQGRGEPDIVAYRWLVVAESAAWAGRYDEGRAAIAAGLALVTGNDALSTARLCAVGLRLEADRCISAHARRAHSEGAAARQRAEVLGATATNVVGRGVIEAGAARARAESLRLGASNPSLLTNEWAGVRDRWRSLRQPYHEGYASLRVAEAELAAGDRRAAASELSSAAALAGQLQAAPLGALIADVARRGAIEAIPSPGSDGLTPREREVLTQVLAGASNRDIARVLFISPKTVSVHVSALLRKFGVSGRGDLMAAAQGSKVRPEGLRSDTF
jgi:DNA-binding CsgD family transcriptional regulator